jgi:hypothetical protein
MIVLQTHFILVFNSDCWIWYKLENFFNGFSVSSLSIVNPARNVRFSAEEIDIFSADL